MKITLISIILFLCLFKSIGQIDELKTNVNLSYLTPLWSRSELQSIEFVNGDKINRALSMQDWYTLNYYNKPAYYILREDKKSLYLYNWFAVNDHRQIALPKDYIIPSKEDVQKLKEFGYNFVFNGFSSGNTVSFSPIGSIAFDDQCNIYKDKSSATFWLRDAYDREYANTFVIAGESAKGSLTISESVALKQDGYAIRLVRPISTFIKDTILDYSRLLPEEMFSIFSSASKKVMNEFRSEKNYNALFNFQLSFDSKGVNKSTSNNCFVENAKKKNVELPIDYFNQGINALHAPFYGNDFIKSEARLSFELNKKTEVKPGFFNDQFDKLSEIQNTSVINSSMRRTSDFEFGAFYTSSESTITYPKTMAKTKYNNPEIVVSERYLKKVRAKGPVYSLLFPIPGLGMSTIKKRQNGFDNYYRVLGRVKLYYISIPIGVLSATSYAISQASFNKYQNSIDNPMDEQYYRRANFFNKASIVGGITYGILGLLDFTVTLGIGTSNKFHQRRINKFIQSRGVKNMGILMNSDEDRMINSLANFSEL